MDESASERVPNLLHFLLFLALTITLFVVAELVAFVLMGQSFQVTAADQKVQLLVMAAGYVLTLAAAWVLFPAVWGRSFLAGLQWKGSAARPVLALFGLVLGFAAQAVDRFLPTPNNMPLDDVVGTPGIIWLLTIFGTVVAPLFEEILFRGFLLAGIGNAVEWLRLPFARTEESERAHTHWRHSSQLSTGAVVIASLLTSVGFAAIHAPQLGYNWAPVTLLVCVSLVLCVVRIRTGSVAASALVHGCYNLATFLLLFATTGGYRHMDQ